MLTKLVRHLMRKLPEDSWLAVFFGVRGVVGHERYCKVAELLTKVDCLTILDIGSGGTSKLGRALQVLSVDVKRKLGVDVVADVLHLPFSDHIFDCVIAIDVLEHIKPSEREKAVNEMKRCGKMVLLHTPLQDDRLFMGRHGDLLLLSFLEKTLHIVDENTLEHLEFGEPRLDELTKQGFRVVEGDWNINLWLLLMKSLYLPTILFAPVMTMLYLLVLRKANNPPFWGAYLISDGNAQSVTI